MPNRRFAYPAARTDNVVEDYHGTPVADPYRWLEDTDTPEVHAWIDAQNRLTHEYLSEIPARPHIYERLTALWNFPRWTAPVKKAGRYFYWKNDGLQNQPVVYFQDGLEAESVETLDPNTLSETGTSALTTEAYSKDGQLLAYGVSHGGSDWQEIRIRRVETGQDYEEVLLWCKFSGVAWAKDGSGFYYNRFPEPGSMPDTEQGAYHGRVYWHTVGTPQEADALVYARPDMKELNFFPIITDDGRYLVLEAWHGAINKNRIYYRAVDSDADSGDDFIRLLDEADAEYVFIGSEGDVFYLQTNRDAPHGRIVAIDLKHPSPDAWRTLIPEGEDVIAFARIVNRQIVVVLMRHVHHRIHVYDLDGTFVRELPLPGIGTVMSVSGNFDDTEIFIDYQSYLQAPAVLRYDFMTDHMSTWRAPAVNFPADMYETRQVFYESRDGTRVPMFITHRRGLALTGDHPTLLYGYGGFSAVYTPAFNAWTLNWLETGGVYCVANIRGGSEYGEAWHQAGMLGSKQNVFDDFIAASEWLIANGYTSSRKLAIMGRSNGGLLVAACMLQRPELFGAVICIVPVTDMLRYHKFTAGRYWTYEYGNAEENPEHFDFLYAYSPLHNVRSGSVYPPILLTTANMDDRVVPLHAKKFTAALQAADTGTNPILLRLDMDSGHGMGKPTSKLIDEWADIQAFLWRTLDMA